MELDPQAAAAGTRLIAFRAIGSTNAEALALARAGEGGPLWITAREQSAGRGRRGRAWVSPPGNLHASLLLRQPSAPARAPELSFVAALALHDGLLAVAPSLKERLRLKWPNDLLLDGAKLAGILLESEMVGEGAFVVVLGFGVNCAHHPEGTPFRACDLAAAGFPATSEHVLAALSRTLHARLAQWDAGAGFGAIREAWVARAAGLGEPIRVRTGTSEIEGRFLELDPTGRLILGLPEGRTRVIAAADIFLLGDRAREGAAA